MKHYQFIDYATQLYLGVVALLILGFHNVTVPEWPYLVVAHLVAMGLIHALIRHHARGTASRGLDFLRHLYPIILYTGFYRETGALNLMFFGDYLDPALIRLEQRLFGSQPCIEFMDRFPYPWLSELLYASYFSYYIMIVGVGLALFARNRAQLFHYVSVVSFVFYLCYLTYIFLPVMGPRVFFREIEGYALPAEANPFPVTPTYPDAVQAGPFRQLMAFIYRNFEAPGAAFPSSHVAIALTTVFFSFRYLRPIRFVHLTVAILLCISTVYCRYHYVVDVVAGVATALALVPLGDWLYRRFHRGPAPAPPTSPPSERPPPGLARDSG